MMLKLLDNHYPCVRCGKRADVDSIWCADCRRGRLPPDIEYRMAEPVQDPDDGDVPALVVLLAILVIGAAMVAVQLVMGGI